MTDYKYKSLINQLSIEEINPSSLEIAKSLHLTIFPVLYPDTFYEEFLLKSNKKCYLIKSIEYIGTISVVFHSDYVYLMTFGLLKEYRRMKIGGYCLLLFEKFVISKGIFQIFLHVQVVNKIACNFYKKNGYIKIKVEENYYESLSNKQAYLFYKQIYKENVNDFLKE